MTFLAQDLSNFNDVFSPPSRGQGLFISFEGIEGSGKSTQIQTLRERFEAQGRTVHCLREPGGTPFGENLRALILGQKTPLDPMAETCLFLASRANLLAQDILPALQNPQAVVLLDRYIDSTLVYQGHARGLSMNPFWAMHQFAPLNLLPHLTVFLDVDVELSLARVNSRGNAKDYFETRAKDFHQKLAEGYRQLAQQFPQRIVRLAGEQGIDQIGAQIWSALEKRGHA